MLRVTKPQKVRWVDEEYRAMVRSESGVVEEYLVDLMENYPVGCCGCEDYLYNRRHRPDVPAEQQRCKHIKAALADLGAIAVREILKRARLRQLHAKAKKHQETHGRSRLFEEAPDFSEEESTVPRMQIAQRP